MTGTKGKDTFDVLREKDPAEAERQRVAVHASAARAVDTIAALANGSSKDRLRVNIQRCIDVFGRHNTDHILPPKPPSQLSDGYVPPQPVNNAEKAAYRVGADTGSSEVQIAILTAKIRTLATALETRGKKDMHNKRNLRVLVHRRQKLLQYLRRRERGGPRWVHCIETLGLTEGTWKGEISM
jgi:ribosomal protein S15